MAEGAERVWSDSMPAAYERWLVPAVFRPFAVELAGRAAARAPRRVLELAAGTGVLTRELLRLLPDADVLATDLNDAMVDLGRTLAPGATWRQADAARLPVEDGTVDLVACAFGAMFFPDKPSAFAEARRVLRPDGALLLLVWAGLQEHGLEAALVEALQRVMPDDPPTFIGDVPHGYRDLDRVAADLRDGGLAEPVVETVTVDSGAATAADVAAGYGGGTPLRAALAARGDVEQLTGRVAVELEDLLGPGLVRRPLTAYLVTAVPAAA